jgi:hypothetical protein
MSSILSLVGSFETYEDRVSLVLAAVGVLFLVRAIWHLVSNAPVLLLDFDTFSPPDEWKVDNKVFIEKARRDFGWTPVKRAARSHDVLTWFAPN